MTNENNDLDRGWYFDQHDGPVGLLEILLGNYEQDREEYWSQREGEIHSARFFYDQCERFADAILHNTEDLVSSELLDADLHALDKQLRAIYDWPTLAEDKYAAIMESDDSWEQKKKRALEEVFHQTPKPPQNEDSSLRLVWEKLAINISGDAISRIETGTNRMLQLHSLELQMRPAKPIQQFLTRLSRCYVWGFDPECIIMCRSVLDTAFREKVPDEMCGKALGTRINHQESFALSDRITVACKYTYISEEAKKLATQVRVRGNKAVHYQPDLSKQVWDTICDTFWVLQELYSPGNGVN